MLGLGPPELLVVMALVLILFGVGKLPQVGGALGKSIREFREASEGQDASPGDRVTPPLPEDPQRAG